MSKFVNILLYFLIAVLFIGTIGIWLPVVIEGTSNSTKINWAGFYQNLTTYFVSISVAGCLELVAHYIIRSKTQNKLGFVLLFILVVLILLGMVVLNSFLIHFEQFRWTAIVAIFGVIIAYLLWWTSNYKNDSMNPSDALG